MLEVRNANPLTGHWPRTVHLATVTKAVNKQVVVLSVGVNENLSTQGRYQLKLLLWMSDYFSVRDPGSLKRVKFWLPKMVDRVQESRDPVFCLLTVPENSDLNRAKVLFFPCVDNYISTKYLPEFAKLLRILMRDGFNISLMGSDTRMGYDRGLEMTSPISTQEGFTWVDYKHWILVGILRERSNSSCVASLRMHPLICAVAQEVPIVSINRSERMSAMTALFDNARTIDLNSLDIERLQALIQDSHRDQRRNSELYPERSKIQDHYQETIDQAIRTMFPSCIN